MKTYFAKPDRRLLASPALIGFLSILVGLGTATAQDPAEPGELPRAVVDTHDLMSLFNEPLYEYLKKAMQEEPGDKEGWETIADRGWQTAEVANLVAMRNDDRQWQKFAADLQQAGTDLAEAAEAEDFDKSQEAYRAVIQRCNGCHEESDSDHAPELKP
ncbi:MAG: hypothetical protein WD342_10255 [Verrucomicrobiales bacterium]